MESELQNLSEDLNVRRKKLESVIEESAEERNYSKKNVIKILKNIDQNTLKIYNRVIEHRGGLAVVPLRDLHVVDVVLIFLHKRYQKLRAKSAVHTCGVCGRFLSQ